MITAFYIILLILGSCFLNFIRGRGIPIGGLSKYLTSFMQGCLTGYIAYKLGLLEQDALHIAVIVWLGMTLWAVPGWGSYFCAFTGDNNTQKKEIPWIDHLGVKLVPQTDTASNRTRGTIQMSLRSLYMYPMHIVLAFTFTPWALVFGLGCTLQGPVYGAMRWLPNYAVHGVMVAEIIYGLVIGFLLSCIVLAGLQC